MITFVGSFITGRLRKILRIRCDDARENKIFQPVTNGAKWKKAIQFEYTTKTPQRKGTRVKSALLKGENSVVSHVPYIPQ